MRLRWKLRLARRSALPRDVVEALPRDRGERILASSLDASGRWVVGTDRALYVPADQAPKARFHRLAWERVEHAEWDLDARVLRVTQTAPLGERLPVWVVRFAAAPDAGLETVVPTETFRLLSLIRERITASVVLDRPVRLASGGGARVIARRSPGMPGEMTWAVALDEGVDPDDPRVRAEAEAALEMVRSEVEP